MKSAKQILLGGMLCRRYGGCAFHKSTNSNHRYAGAPTATVTLDGKQLPPLSMPFKGVIKQEAKDSKSYWLPRVVPPKGAPNVLLIMTDDAGFGVSNPFGSVIPTPSMDRVAKDGLRYTQFHSTALCSPTRAALITGRNHHSVGSVWSASWPPASRLRFDHRSGQRHDRRDPEGEWLRHLVVRQNHNTPSFSTAIAGPFDQWPSGMGFEYFYGFMGGETDQWTPLPVPGSHPDLPVDWPKRITTSPPTWRTRPSSICTA